MTPSHLRRSLVAAVLSLGAASGAGAQDAKLPPTITFTAYDTGTSGFNIAVAVAKALKDKYNVDGRVLPAGNDVARLAPLRAGRAQIAATGASVYFAQEGVFEFATREWGPQQLSVLLSTIDCNGLGIGATKDSGVSELKGLRGKRVGFVVGAPALNQPMIGMLAFGGLTKQDVKVVEFASNGAMWKGVLNNEIDAAFSSTISGPVREVEASPRGILWLPMPHDDEAAWGRMRKVVPYFVKHKTSCGVSVTKPFDFAAYPYPIMVVYPSATADFVYATTKAMIASYDAYKDGAPGASGLSADRQTRQWVVPVHAGAAKALKEVGQWSEADEAHSEALRKRQDVLKAAWAAFMKTNPSEDKDKFRTDWLAARKAALAGANLPDAFGE